MTETVEFEAELTGSRTLVLPPEVVAALPSQGKATILIVVGEDSEDVTWRKAAYERFLRDDSDEDAVYDKYH